MPSTSARHASVQLPSNRLQWPPALCNLLTAAYKLYEGDGAFAQATAGAPPLVLHDREPLPYVQRLISAIMSVVDLLDSAEEMISHCSSFRDDLIKTQVRATLIRGSQITLGFR
jgi:hypothetical protein